MLRKFFNFITGFLFAAYFGTPLSASESSSVFFDSKFKNRTSKSEQKRKVIKILSIDGGGAGALAPVTMLAALEQKVGKPIAEQFDLISGSGTGASLALTLATHKSTAESLLGHYEAETKSMLQTPYYINTLFGGKTKYKKETLHNYMKKQFGEEKLSDAKTDVMTMAYDLKQRRNKTFTSWGAKKKPSTDFDTADLATASMMRPEMFGSLKVTPKTKKDKDSLNLIASLRVTNPTLHTLRAAERLYGDDVDFVIVSLGAGKAFDPIRFEETENYSQGQWASIKHKLMAEDDSTHEFVMDEIEETNHKYYRFQPTLSAKFVNEEIDVNAKTITHVSFRTGRLISKDQKDDFDEVSTLLS